MAIIWTISAIAIYQVFARSLYQELDNRLLTLADAAAHSLAGIKARAHNSDGDEPFEESERESNYERGEEAVPNPPGDQDGDLDIAVQDIQKVNQGIEWFDVDRHFLSRQGTVFPTTKPLNVDALASGHTITSEHLRTLTLAVYDHEPDDQASYAHTASGQAPISLSGAAQCTTPLKPMGACPDRLYHRDHYHRELVGYVRASASTTDMEALLATLRWGLGLGGALAMGLMTVAGRWLTQQAIQPIERSFQQLQQFTADASHELRSPLTVIRTSVEVMHSHPERIHPADVKKMGAIASAIQQMTRLVDDLLLLARMDMVQPSTHQQWRSIPIQEVLEDLIDGLESQAEQQQLTLRTCFQQTGDRVPESGSRVWEPQTSLLASKQCYVMGDSSHLTRVFAILLQNAFQYTPSGGMVTVSLTNGDRTLSVRIQDTGIGIAPEDLPLIFDRFWRADRARSHHTGGLGLGLAIAQSIVHCHGGSISVSSTLGEGTCVQVTLPLHF